RFFPVLGAFVFFAFFGFADEARRNYRLSVYVICKRADWDALSHGSSSTNSTTPNTSYSNSSGAMPIPITHQTEKKRDSMVSCGALAGVKKESFSPTASSTGSMSKESLADLHSVPLPSLPEATLDTSAPSRYALDVPNAV
ncbi:hypothetical protein J3R82DRAFT_2677, partial [Butyriboletus roseoflavus]